MNNNNEGKIANRCENIDTRLKIHDLKKSVWGRNVIKNDQNSNGEIFLLELVNNSEYFINKTSSHKYEAPETESDGECDANGNDYCIDFKTLIFSSMACAEANTQLQIEQISNGCYVYLAPKAPVGKEYKGYCALRALREYTCEDIISKKYNDDDKNLTDDIEAMLKWLFKEKNLLMFLPSNFTVDDISLDKEQKISILTDAMQHDAYKLFELRKMVVPQFDTYLCTILDDEFIIFDDSNNALRFVESVSTEKCPTFGYLAGLSL